MSQQVDDLTVRWQDNGVDTVLELAKVVLAASPSWATLAFLARERDPNTGDWRAPRVQLRRYKRRGGKWIVDKHFALTTSAQAMNLIDALSGWFAEGGPGRVAGTEHDDDGETP